MLFHRNLEQFRSHLETTNNIINLSVGILSEQLEPWKSNDQGSLMTNDPSRQYISM